VCSRGGALQNRRPTDGSFGSKRAVKTCPQRRQLSPEAAMAAPHPKIAPPEQRHEHTTTIPGRPADDTGQHARQRGVVARGLVLATKRCHHGDRRGDGCGQGNEAGVTDAPRTCTGPRRVIGKRRSGGRFLSAATARARRRRCPRRAER
jgi:hypothetical protein